MTKEDIKNCLNFSLEQFMASSLFKNFPEFKEAIKIKITNEEKIKNLKIPKNILFQHKYLIEYAGTIIYLKEKIKNLYTISLHFFYKDEIYVVPLLLDTEKYPRIYTKCSMQETCSYANLIEKKPYDFKFCMKTPRVAHVCEGVENDGFKIFSSTNTNYATITDRNIWILDLLVKLSGYLNSVTYKQSPNSNTPNSNTPNSNTTNSNTTNSHKTTINYSPIIYVDSAPTRITRTKTAKCKHHRRGHFRRVGDRLVKVRACIINKDKNDKTYKI